jgi:hypothetical protein
MEETALDESRPPLSPPLGLILLFLASRLLILLGFRQWVTDMPIYAHAALRGLVHDERAYCDFPFVYPPLSLGLVYLPGLVASAPAAYATAFRLQMFALDAACFVVLWLVLTRRLAAGARPARNAALLYCALGPLVGHLIYDRLDLALALVFVSFLFLHTGSPRQRLAAHVVLAAGILVKIVPVFLVPIAAVLEGVTKDGGSRLSARRAAVPVLVAGGLAGGLLGAYAAAACSEVLAELARHGTRGIEVESLWASPLLLHALLAPSSPIGLEFSLNAWHLKGVPPAYLWLSKYGMAAALLLYYAAVLAWARRHRARLPAPDLQRTALFATAVLLLLLASARVLSPQYLIWLLPLAPILLAAPERRTPVVLGSLLLFGLTYAAFDLGFFRIVKLDPLFVTILVARNAFLAICTGVVVRWSLKPLEDEKSAA